MLASVAVWQLPSTEPVLKQQMECSLSLPPVPRVVTTPDVPAIPSVPKSGHAPAARCLCVLDPAPELGQSQPITGDQAPSPLLGLVLPLQVAEVMDDLMDGLSRKIVHRVRSYGRCFV